ncbi:type II toxin-antitoxin system RelE/ParE family toxin [Ferrovibrio sp.]|uniref:type II toxin-antitoxin system RelE/ParE family toxin n=1 Tax=Ferrovibrio sp. TaxID=1917215 RepID=UPI0035AF0383
MRVRWAVSALTDFSHTIAFIAETDPTQAERIALALRMAGETLARFPHRGRPGRLKQTRELVLSGLPWFIVYRVMNDGVEILRVIHGARDWPPP